MVDAMSTLITPNRRSQHQMSRLHVYGEWAPQCKEKCPMIMEGEAVHYDFEVNLYVVC